MKRLIDYDPLTKVSTFFDYVPETDTTIVSREQDIASILEANKRLQNDEQYTRDGIKEEFWHYATIPNIVIEKWKNEEGIDVFNKNHERRVFQKLNSPEYRYLKTTTKIHLPKGA